MFLFAIVNQGSENKLKEEMSIKYPYLKPSYSRKGFVSFKNIDESVNLLHLNREVEASYRSLIT